MLDELKADVCRANQALVSEGLVFRTFGNASGVDRQSGHMVIKPSGVAYAELTPEKMVVVSLETGDVVEGKLSPSSDTPTHVVLYRAFEAIGGIVHTHSLRATAWAQARREIPLLGTTHADYFPGAVPLTRSLTEREVRGEYEANTGDVIVERFAGLSPEQVPAVLVAEHGPFAWGATPDEAVFHAALLEYLATLAIETLHVKPYPKPPSQALVRKHFERKHGPNATYGQRPPE
jgi:L-ribulose-5-phosphate 4-epimerase